MIVIVYRYIVHMLIREGISLSACVIKDISSGIMYFAIYMPDL